MNIITYDQKYDNQVVDLWNKTCTFDALDIHKFRKQALLDDNFDPSLAFIALENDEVIGFTYGTKRKFPYLERGLEPDRGWINVLFVDKSYWHKGIGKALLEKIESSLKELGCKNITLGAYSPNYFFWGVDKVNYKEAANFFEKYGYHEIDTHYSMGRNLHGFQIEEKILEKKKSLEEKGYQFKNFTYNYAIELLEFLKKEFGGGWKRNALISMQEDQAQDRIVIVIDPKGKICGCCMRAIDDNPMRFGPIGIAESKRNEGIGSVLLQVQLFEMAKKGIYRMYFVTTDEPGKRYYERNGLEVIRTTTVYKKELV